MKDLSPRFLDGMTSKPQQVRLSFTDQSLLLLGDADVITTWPYIKILVKEDWVDGVGAILGHKDHPDAGLSIYREQDFKKIQQKLSRRDRASFIIPTQYRHIFLMALGAVAAGFILFPVVTNMASFMTHFIPKSAERQLGDFAISQLSLEYTPCNDPVALRHLQTISKRLLAGTNEKNAVLDIHIFRADTANAFSLPGEKFAVLSAFLNDAQSENEVASVMAHEMGHLEKHDALEGFVQSQGLSIIGAMAGTSGSYGDVTKFASFLQTMNYSRKKEFDADEYGAKLLLKTGYSPKGLASFLSRMDKMDNGMMGEVIRHAEFLSTHPNTEERVKRIKAFGGTDAYKPSLSVEEFKDLKNACRSISKALKSEGPPPLPKSEGLQE
jgi:predicted Zn-dependent protease